MRPPHTAARVWPELAENEPAAVLTNVDVLLHALTAKACVPNCNPSVLMKVCVSVFGMKSSNQQQKSGRVSKLRVC